MTVLFIKNAVINSHFYYSGEIYSLGGSAETTAIAAGQAVTYPATASASGGKIVTVTLATGPLDDIGASTIYGYVPGATTHIIATPASGGSTVDGLDSTNVSLGHTVLWQNASTTDSIIFPHLAAASLAANRFSNENAASVSIPPLGAARCSFINNQWQFA